jgi:hypothetical protein
VIAENQEKFGSLPEELIVQTFNAFKIGDDE